MEPKARILVVEAAPSLGGSLTSIEIVLRHGISRGFAFDILSRREVSQHLPPGVGCWPFPCSAKRPLRQDFLTTWTRLASGSYDLLLLNNLLSENFPSLLAGLSKGLPVVQMVRAYERESRSWRWLSPWVDAFVPVSQSVSRRLQQLGAPQDKLHLAYEGIAPAPLPPPNLRKRMRIRWQVDADARVLGFVGRLVAWKGYELFVEAAAEAAARDPKLVALVVGEAPPEQQAQVQQLQASLDARGLSSRIRFLGGMLPEDIPPFLCSLDLFVHSSLTPEPFGRVLLEAMRFGIPVISSAEGGPREILTDGIDGRLLPPNEAGALATAIHWFFAQPDRLRTLGLAGRDTVARRFGEEVCAAPVLSLFHSLTHRLL